MFKMLFKPAESGFSLLKAFGTLANIAAIFVLLFSLSAVILAVVGSSGTGLQLNALLPVLLAFIYVPALLLLGQLLHWMAAMYELRRQANEQPAAGKE
jgi:hypothetical protein